MCCGTLKSYCTSTVDYVYYDHLGKLGPDHFGHDIRMVTVTETATVLFNHTRINTVRDKMTKYVKFIIYSIDVKLQH